MTDRKPKPTRGGDHELDVVGILRRAREPEGLAQLRTAIEHLGAEKTGTLLTEILEVVHDSRQQIQSLALAIGELAQHQGADHLVDVTKLDTYTVTQLVPTPLQRPDVGGDVSELRIEPPHSAFYFETRAVAVSVVDPDDHGQPRDLTFTRVTIGHEPQLLGEVLAERWAAPPGRGHPLQWRVFSSMALMHYLSIEVRVPQPALLRITLSGRALQDMPMPSMLPPRPQWRFP